MNAKITAKPIGDGTRGFANVSMKLWADDGETGLANDRIENVIIVGFDSLDVTVDEIEAKFNEIKAGLYMNGSGMHAHQIYKMAVVALVSSRLGRNWIIQ